jgi:uncharacterized protein (TIGR03083 family)
MADAHDEALRASVARLRELTSEMNEADLSRQAYPAEWTIADVLSHLGSAAVITQRRLEDALAGRDTPDDFAPGVWDTWNAKSPTDKRNEALAADGELLARIDAVTPDERRTFTTAVGPLTIGFDQLVAMRLNEHAFHTWDIEVIVDPDATIPRQSTELVVDNLELIARFTAKPTGDETTLTVVTSDPERHFTIELTNEAVVFSAGTTGAADLELPSEAFARLIYGRLDPDHTPAGVRDNALTVLRRAFPGP